MTTEELRMLPEVQGQSEDQQDWLTTGQAGFPTTPLETPRRDILTGPIYLDGRIQISRTGKRVGHPRHIHDRIGSRDRDPGRHSLGTEPPPVDDQPPSKNHNVKHEVSLTIDDRGLLSDYSRRTDYLNESVIDETRNNACAFFSNFQELQ